VPGGGVGVVNGYGYFAPPSALAGVCSGTNLAAGTCGNIVVPVAVTNAGWNSTVYSGQFMPDFIANIRVDQAWGDAQISGALHQLKTGIVTSAAAAFADAVGGGVAAGLPWAPDKYGYAVLAGINIKLPQLGAGDSFQIEGAWAKGAVDYTGTSANPYSTNLALGYRKGFYGPVIALFDSYVNANGQNLSTAWSINAEIRHFWTPTLRSSLSYGYNKFNVPAAAKNPLNAQGALVTNAPNGFIANFPDGKIDQVTANLIWSPVPKLDLGVEGVWVRMSTDCAGLPAANCSAITEATRGKSTDTWGGTFRARRDF